MNFYSKNVKEELGISDHIFFDEWYGIVENILLNEEFQKRKLFKHHKDKSVWEHSIEVSYSAFIASKYFNADSRVCAIAGLLHDFYTQAWLYSEELADYDSSYLQGILVNNSLFKKHGFTHANDAMNNVLKFFPEYNDKKILNSIKRHMFPLNICPPRYREGWIITAVDKRNSIFELPVMKCVPNVNPKKLFELIKDKVYNE